MSLFIPVWLIVVLVGILLTYLLFRSIPDNSGFGPDINGGLIRLLVIIIGGLCTGIAVYYFR